MANFTIAFHAQSFFFLNSNPQQTIKNSGTIASNNNYQLKIKTTNEITTNWNNYQHLAFVDWFIVVIQLTIIESSMEFDRSDCDVSFGGKLHILPFFYNNAIINDCFGDTPSTQWK